MEKKNTIIKAKSDFLAAYQGRVGLRGKFGRTAQSFNQISYDLDRCLEGIDGKKDILSLTRRDIEAFCGYWMGQDIAGRTAWNRIQALKQLLDWANDSLDGFIMPKGVRDLFKECRPVANDKVPTFNPVELAKLLDASNDKVRMYAYVAMNLGAYQTDLATLKPECLQDGVMAWRRCKTEHQGSLDLFHHLWPETIAMISKCRRNNRHGLLLTNDEGEPLVKREVGKRDCDAISTAWSRANRAAGTAIRFKDLRKYGATAVARIADLDTSRMYRGESIRGSSKSYVLQAFTEKLSPALAAWGDELRKDGVLK